MIQIKSTKDPFTTPALARQAVGALERAEAMGLLPANETIEVLDRAAVTKVAGHIARAGLGHAVVAQLAQPALTGEALEQLLGRLNEILDQSPVPAHEWPRLVDLFGAERLGDLLGISPSSVRRYRAQARITPDDIAARLHFLALVVGDLAGAYNEVGIRRWFERKRSQLGGRAPLDLLRSGWDPNDPGPRQVRELARALLAAPAT